MGDRIKPYLSVIIPVYNVEEFLPKCIDSILKNNLDNIEVILVNDGSSDNSGDICDAFAKEYPFIYVFHKENGGVSSSRNLGLDKATGEWIYFIDGDDWISPDTFSILNGKIIDVDIIQFGYQKINERGNVLYEMKPQFESSYGGADEYFLSGNFVLMNIVVSMFKRALIEQYKIRFSNKIKCGEDLEFGVKCFATAQNIFVLDKCFYHYLERKGSAMESKVSLESVVDHLEISKNIIKFYADLGIPKNAFFQYQVLYFVKSFFSRSLLLSEGERSYVSIQKSYDAFYDQNRQYLKNIFLKISRLDIRFYRTILKIRRLF